MDKYLMLTTISCFTFNSQYHEKEASPALLCCRDGQFSDLQWQRNTQTFVYFKYTDLKYVSILMLCLLYPEREEAK